MNIGSREFSPLGRQFTRVRKLGRLVAYIVMAISLAIVGTQIVRQGDEIRAFGWHFGWQTVAATSSVMIGQVTISYISLCWLKCLGIQPYWKDVIRIYLISQPLKYLPIGGVFNVTGQTAALGRLPGVGLPYGATAVGLTQAVVFVSSVAWYGLTLCLRENGSFRIGLLMITVLPASLIALLILPLWQRLPLYRLLKNENQNATLRFCAAREVPRLISMVLLALATWGLFGLSLVLITSQMVTIQPPTAVQLSGVMSLAWIAGFISFVAPAGLGVRDAAMIVLLQAVLNDPVPVVLSLVSRIIWIAADLCNYFAALLILRSPLSRPYQLI